MLLRYNKKTIDLLLLIFIYLQLVILEFFGYGRTLNKVICVFIILRLFMDKGNNLIRKKMMYIIALIVLFGISILISNPLSLDNVKSNILMQIYPMIYVFYVSYICINEPDMIDSIFKKGFWVFNITMIANLLVMLIQIYVPYSIIAVAGSNEIGFYKDTISGLFAYSSTHIVCLFTIFIVIYDLNWLKRNRNIIKKRFLIVYLFVIAVASLFIAVNNDNKALFLLLPFSLLIYVLMGDITKKRLKNIFIIIFFIFVVLFGLYTFNDVFRIFMDDNVLRLIDMMLNAISLGNKANGSNERIAILGYALKKPSTWFVGVGFGSSFIYQSGVQGFNHFGQADMGALLVLGGFWYTLILICYYISSFSEMVLDASLARGKKVIKYEIVLFFLIIDIYTQCLTRTNVMVCMLLIMLAFRMKIQSKGIQIRTKGEVKKMKIGILTFTDGTNIGQRLQNYALQKVLINMGNEVYTIRQDYPFNKVKREIRKIITFVKAPSVEMRKKKRNHKFTGFNRKFINMYPRIMSFSSNNESFADEFDVFIVGSDQVWNPYSPFVGDNFFLRFARREQRMTYAPSFSVDKIPENKRDEYRDKLNGFDFVCVREDRGEEIVKFLTGREAMVVLDPTLLLTREEWNQVKSKIYKKPEEKYILSLFLGKEPVDKINEIKEYENLSVFKLDALTEIGPDEFLTIIEGATIVLTDSYHVTIFSLIYQVPFVNFMRLGKDVSMNSRFETLYRLVGIKNRNWDYLKDHKSEIETMDFTEIEERIDKTNKTSLTYLKSQLRERMKKSPC